MNKKLSAWLLAALLLVSLSFSAQAVTPVAAVPNVLLDCPEAEAQILRKRPSDKAESLGWYFNGVTAYAAQAPEKGWLKVNIGGLSGYLKEENVKTNLPEGFEPPALPVVEVAYQDGPALTLRAAQSFKSKKLKGYPNGTEMTVLGFTEEFVHVIGPDGRSGFMMAWGVSPQPTAADFERIAVADEASASAVPAGERAAEAPAATPPAKTELIRVKNPGGEGANLRKKASTGSESLGLYPNGSKVYLVKWGEWWCKIWVDGHTGYMMTKMLGVKQERNNPPQPTQPPVNTEGLDQLKETENFDFEHWADLPAQGTP